MSDFSVDDVDDEGGDRRRLLIGGGVAAALLLLVGSYFLLSGGSSDVATGAVPHGVPRHVGSPVATPTPLTLPAVSTAHLGRDPFKPLYVAPAAPAAPAPRTGDTGSAAGTGTGTGTTPTSTGGTSSGSTTPTATTHALKLSGVTRTGSSLTGRFVIDGAGTAAKVGSVFGPTGELQLLSLKQDAQGRWIATIKVGDSGPVDTVPGGTLYVA